MALPNFPEYTLNDYFQSTWMEWIMGTMDVDKKGAEELMEEGFRNYQEYRESRRARLALQG